MEKVLKNFYKSTVITSILLFIFGLLLIFKSEIALFTISYVVGTVLIAIGIMGFIEYFTYKTSLASFYIIYGVISIILGVVIILKPDIIANMIPIVIGLGIIINSVIKLRYSLDLKQYGSDKWFLVMIAAIISTFCGVIITFNPFAGAVIITKMIGVFICVYSIIDIISMRNLKKDVKDIKDTIASPIYEGNAKEKKKKRG